MRLDIDYFWGGGVDGWHFHRLISNPYETSFKINAGN